MRRLPSHSHYVAAQRNDPQLAEWIAGQPERARWSPPPSEWDLGTELQAATVDRLGDLLTAVVNQRARRPMQPPERYPRPVTAIEKAKARAERQVERALEDLIETAHTTWATEHRGEA